MEREGERGSRCRIRYAYLEKQIYTVTHEEPRQAQTGRPEDGVQSVLSSNNRLGLSSHTKIIFLALEGQRQIRAIISLSCFSLHIPFLLAKSCACQLGCHSGFMLDRQSVIEWWTMDGLGDTSGMILAHQIWELHTLVLHIVCVTLYFMSSCN